MGGGSGGTTNTGGMGSGTTSAGGAGTGGAGGAPPANVVEAIYPYCGCISDSQQAGACSNCLSSVDVVAECAMQSSDCAGGCDQMLAALDNCDAFADPGCLDAVYDIAPDEWDDLIALLSCQCGACPAPDQCDTIACTP